MSFLRSVGESLGTLLQLTHLQLRTHASVNSGPEADIAENQSCVTALKGFTKLHTLLLRIRLQNCSEAVHALADSLTDLQALRCCMFAQWCFVASPCSKFSKHDSA